MPSPKPQFILSSKMAYQLAAAVRGQATARVGTVTRVRRALVTATPRARRIGSVVVPLVGLRLFVYRVTLLGAPFELVTRGRRVVGVVRCAPGARGASGRARVSLSFEQETAPFSPSSLEAAKTDRDEVLSEREALELAFELLGAETEEELDQFLGKVFKSVSKAAQGVAKSVSSAGKAIGKVVDTVNKFVPVKALMSFTPMGMTLRAAQGLKRVASGENVFKVAGNMVKSGLKDVGQVMQAASTVASFVPGLGTGVGAALGAAGALAQGRPITEAVMSAVKGALPGGAIAAAAFDVASGLAKGQSLSESALSAARNQLPGGPAARAAFDAGLALARGKKLQDVALSTAGTFVPKNRFTNLALNAAR
jgi:hypothetical protein